MRKKYLSHANAPCIDYWITITTNYSVAQFKLTKHWGHRVTAWCKFPFLPTFWVLTKRGLNTRPKWPWMLFKPNYYIIFGRAFCNWRHAYAVNEFQKNEQKHNATHLLHTNFRWRKKTWTPCHLRLKIIKMVPSNLHPVNKFQQGGQQVRCKALALYQFFWLR